MRNIGHIFYSIRQKIAISGALKRSTGVYQPVKLPNGLLTGMQIFTMALCLPILTTCLVVVPSRAETEKSPVSVPVVYRILENQDPGLALYRDSVSKEAVLSFYTDHVGDRRIAEAIAREASANNIPLTLAYSLAWAESRFFSRAVNYNHSSIDRGLFQLNSKSFPDLSLEEYFDPDTSAKVGLSYLRWCIDTGRDEVVALAMYNAGQGRVEGAGTPLTTLRHISDILEYRDRLDRQFSHALKFTTVVSSRDSAKSKS